MLARDVLMKTFGIFGKGEDYTKEVEDRIIESLKRPYIKGFHFFGGEPMHPNNQKKIAELVERVRKELPDKTIWCYSRICI